MMKRRRKPLDASAWYHGSITRIAAELSLARDGDFLVRDCISAPGNYVLTCRWRGQILNFRMNRVPNSQEDQESPSEAKFQFEDEAFSNVEDLVLFHWHQQRPISQISGALIRNPIHREGTSEQENNINHASGPNHFPSTSSSSCSPHSFSPTTLQPCSQMATDTSTTTSSSNGLVMKMASESNAQTDGEKGSYFFSENNFVVKHRDAGGEKAMGGGLGRQTQSMILETVPNFHVPLPDDSHDRQTPLDACQPRPRYQFCAMSLPRTKSSDVLLSTTSSPESSAIKTNPINTFSTFKRSPSESNIPPLVQVPLKARVNDGLGTRKSKAFASDPFPKDIDLPVSPSSSDSTIYDVPRKPRPCLSEKQIQCNGLYDQPRVLKIPPPPPPRCVVMRNGRKPVTSLSVQPSLRTKKCEPKPIPLVNNGGTLMVAPSSTVVMATHPQSQGDELASDCQSLASETDTSYLEHRELTPLLSSDNDSLLFDSSSLPGDPFPAGLPANGSHHQSNNNSKNMGSATSSEETQSSSSTSTSCSSSSLSPLSCSNHPPLPCPSSEYIIRHRHQNPKQQQQQQQQRQQQSHHNHQRSKKERKQRSSHPSASQERRSVFHESLQGERLFLKSDNKPLDPEAITEAHRILLSTNPEDLAFHMTHLDMELLSIRLDHEYADLPEITSGLHLITLVDGKFLREDVIERALCLRIFVLVSIFTSTNWTQSVRTLAQWIEVAEHCLDTLGNHFSFFNITSALSHTHLQELSKLWQNLEQNHPSQALKYSQHLRPRMKAMNTLSGDVFGNGVNTSRSVATDDVSGGGEDSVRSKASEEHKSGSQPITTIPHIVPFLSGCKDLKDKRTFRLLYKEIFLSSPGDSDQSLGDSSKDSGDESSLFQLHLAEMNKFLQRIEDFKAQADTLMVNFKTSDEAKMEIFRTDFHLRLFWGSRGCMASTEERHMKFDKVINALATICKNIEKTLP